MIILGGINKDIALTVQVSSLRIHINVRCLHVPQTNLSVLRLSQRSFTAMMKMTLLMNKGHHISG